MAIFNSVYKSYYKLNFTNSGKYITTNQTPLSSIGFSRLGKKILTNAYTANYIYYGEAGTAFPTSGSITFNGINYGSNVRTCGYFDDNYFWVGNDSSLTVYSGTPTNRTSKGSVSASGRVWGACMTNDGTNLFVADSQTTLKSYSLSTAWDLSTAVNTGTFTTSGVRGLSLVDINGFGPCIATLGTNFINIYKLNNYSVSNDMELIANQTQSRTSSMFGIWVTPDCSKLYVATFNDSKIYVRENQN